MFLYESSQIRNRAYTDAPANRIERIVSVGRLFVILTSGATTAVIAEFALALPFAFFAVTVTRRR